MLDHLGVGAEPGFLSVASDPSPDHQSSMPAVRHLESVAVLKQPKDSRSEAVNSSRLLSLVTKREIAG